MKITLSSPAMKWVIENKGSVSPANFISKLVVAAMQQSDTISTKEETNERAISEISDEVIES